MEHIWAPWRMGYIESAKTEECFLCEHPKQKDDVTNHIIHRGKLNFVILNRWPYNPGHLMVVPYSHLPDLEKFTDGELQEHWQMVTRCVAGLKTAIQPAGFNIGINLGKVSGAGVADHVHTHIVPRWEGDVNFMPVVSDTRVIPEGLAATYEKLKGPLRIALGG